MTLFDLIQGCVARHGDRTAYLVRGEGGYRPVTYRDWFARLEGLAAFLVESLGVRRGENVALFCDNRFEWKMLCLAITTVGGVDVPRGANAPPGELRAILEHAGCRVAFVENERTLRRLAAEPRGLGGLSEVVCVDPRSTWGDPAGAPARLGRARLHFLEECLDEGASILEGAGGRRGGREALARRRSRLREDDLATIIYTSGTTGAPKGVMLDHRALCWSAARLAEHLPFGQGDRVAVFLPPWHIAERMLELVSLATGATLAISSVATLARDLPEVRPTVLFSVPRVWESIHRRALDRVRSLAPPARALTLLAIRLAELHRDQTDRIRGWIAVAGREEAARERRLRALAFPLVPFTFVLQLPARPLLRRARAALGGRLRYAVSGAGALPTGVVRFFRAVGIPIVDAYGMTETSALGAMGRPERPIRGAIGSVLPGCRIELRDPTGAPIREPGRAGIAWHRGPHVTRGYYRDPDATAARLVDGWLDSGDLLAWTRGGELRFAGRAKDTIVLRSGENVEPEPIERAIGESELVARVIVVGQDRKGLGALIVPAWDRTERSLAAAGRRATLPRERWNEDPEVRRLFAAILRKATSPQRGFAPHERVHAFALLPRDLSDRELTQTLKIKRAVVLERLRSRIDALFDPPGPVC